MSSDVFRHSIRSMALSGAGADWEERPSDAAVYGAKNWPSASPERANYRMVGVAYIARGLGEGRPPRASRALALHILKLLEAGASGTSHTMNTTEMQPER